MKRQSVHLFVVAVLALLGPMTQKGRGDTEVGGIIDINTTWSAPNSPYILISDVQLAYGATLTIEPNVIVDGNGLSIKVWGILDANGNAESRIIFNDVHIKPGTNYWETTRHLISVKFCEINGGAIYEPSGTYGSLILQDSILRNITGGSPYLYLHYPTSDCYIERNIFENSGGISVGIDGSRKVYVRNNVFYKQTRTDGGVYAVENWVSYANSELIVRYNSFLSNDRIALRLPSGSSQTRMTATENFWNTSDTKVIDSMIYDRNDDLACAGYIIYTPILTEPHPDTPIFLLDQELTVQTEPNYIDTVIPSVGQHTFSGWVDVSATRFIDCPGVYSFDHWEGDVEDANSTSTRVFMNGEKSITAVFVDDRQCGDECHPYPAGDISKDCKVDFFDIAMVANSWLECTKPECD